MAGYVPTALVTQVALGTTASTGVYTPASSHTGIIRTIQVETTGSGKNFTASIGTDGAGTRLFDAVALTASSPFIQNAWYVVPTSVAFNLYCAATAVNGGIYGYDFS